MGAGEVSFPLSIWPPHPSFLLLLEPDLFFSPPPPPAVSSSPPSPRPKSSSSRNFLVSPRPSVRPKCRSSSGSGHTEGGGCSLFLSSLRLLPPSVSCPMLLGFSPPFSPFLSRVKPPRLGPLPPPPPPKKSTSAAKQRWGYSSARLGLASPKERRRLRSLMKRKEGKKEKTLSLLCFPRAAISKHSKSLFTRAHSCFFQEGTSCALIILF